MEYLKPAIHLDKQIELLKERGLEISDIERAKHYLSNISFYRLRAYTYPFQDNEDPNHPFIQKVNFNGIIDLYVFDRKLRLLIFDAIEKIEIAFRTKVIYHLSITYGPHWFEDKSLYRNKRQFETDMAKLNGEIERSTETFIKHYRTKYTKPSNPAAWMSLEVSSISLISKLYENLNECKEKQIIADEFGLNTLLLKSWIRSLAYLRNICAHHGRIWNRRLTMKALIPQKSLKFTFLSNTKYSSKKIYHSLSCIIYILQIINPGHTFKDKILALLKDCSEKRLEEMGFPEGWKKESLWAV